MKTFEVTITNNYDDTPCVKSELFAYIIENQICFSNIALPDIPQIKLIGKILILHPINLIGKLNRIFDEIKMELVKNKVISYEIQYKR